MFNLKRFMLALVDVLVLFSNKDRAETFVFTNVDGVLAAGRSSFRGNYLFPNPNVLSHGTTAEHIYPWNSFQR